MVLLADAEVDESTELNAERVEVRVGLLDGRPVHAVEECDLHGGQGRPIEQVFRSGRRSTWESTSSDTPADTAQPCRRAIQVSLKAACTSGGTTD